MSVLVRGMEMPKGCFFCPMRIKIDPDTIRCLATGNDFEETFAGTIERRNNGNCPLLEVKEPHGRLGDLDELKLKFRHSEGDNDADSAWISTVRRFITQADTIIEAEGGERQ